MQRLFNLDKWTPLSEGRALAFDLDRPRVVRLDVNSAGPCNLYVMQREQEGSDASFLARVEGRDVIEFHVNGAFALVADGDGCNVYTVDGDVWTFRDLAPEIFTRIHERRVRNPELEYILAKMQANMERRLATQADEIRGAIERRERARSLPSPASGDGGKVQPASESGDGRSESADGDGATPGRRKAKATGSRDDEV